MCGYLILIFLVYDLLLEYLVVFVFLPRRQVVNLLSIQV